MANPPVVMGGRGCRALFGLTRRLSRWADAGALARGPHAPAPRRHRLRATPGPLARSTAGGGDPGPGARHWQ